MKDKRPTQQIQMREKPLLQTERAMQRNVINNSSISQEEKHNRMRQGLEERGEGSPGRLLINKDKFENVQIFNENFRVAPMEQPKVYLPNYSNQPQQEDNFVSVAQTACGQCLMVLGTLFAPCCCKCCIYELSTSSVGLVQRFGRFNRLLKPGFNRINPCSQSVNEVDMKIRLLSTGNNIAITKDNVNLNIQTSVAFRITNPIIVYYKLGNELNKSIVQLTISSFRHVIGEHVLQQILTDRMKLVEKILKQLHSNLPEGLSIETVFLQNISLPAQIERDLSSVARTKRTSQANIISTKADVESAQLMKQSAQLLDTKAAMQIRYLELVEELGKRGSTLLMDIGVDKQMKTTY